MLGRTFLSLLLVLTAASQEPIYLGVLEDSAVPSTSEASAPVVRTLFQKSGDQWSAFPHKCPDKECLKSISVRFPKEVTWTVAFNGKRLAKIRAVTPDFYEHPAAVGEQEIVEGARPVIGKPSNRFRDSNFPVARPLVATSSGRISDPEQWRLAKAAPAQVRKVRAAFRALFKDVRNCKAQTDTHLLPYEFKDADIRIETIYTSNKHWSLIEVELHEYRCDGPPDDAFLSQWFLRSPSNQITHLGSQMTFVDSGDFDGDGNSELVFAHNSHEVSGYRLYSNRFRHKADFLLSHH